MITLSSPASLLAFVVDTKMGSSTPTSTASASPPGTPSLRVVGFGDTGDATHRTAAARRRALAPPESPLGALLRSASSFPCLPALAIRRPKSPGSVAGPGGGSRGGSPGAVTPARGERVLARSFSGPVNIPPVR